MSAADGRSHTTAHCPRCHAGRTFQLGHCVVCGHTIAEHADRLARLAIAFTHHNPALSIPNAIRAAHQALLILDQPDDDPGLAVLEGGEAA